MPSPEGSMVVQPPPVIPGVDPIKPETLAPEFRKFRKDVLYYIDHIAYYEREQLEKAPSNRKAVPRVLALTPQAAFVCDTMGMMSRASRLDLVKELIWDAYPIKKLFGTQWNTQLVMKIPEEYDIFVEFENDSQGGNKVEKFCEIFSKVAGHRAGAPIPYKKRDGDKTLEQLYVGTPPANFISPQQIMALNQLRRDFEQRVTACEEEYYNVEDQLKKKRAAVQSKRKEHQTLESSVGADVATLQKQLETTRQKQIEAQRKLTTAEMELMKTVSDVEALRAQLAEEKVNFEVLVKARVAAGDSPELQEQQDMQKTLKRAHAREIEKATNALAAAKATFQKPSYDAAPGPLAQRANEVEDKLRAGVDRWERDTSADIKIHQKLEQESDDLAKLAEQLREVLEKKAKLIEAKKPKELDSGLLDGPAAPAGGGDAAGLGFDDDLLGGGGADTAPAAAAAAGGADMDDLLGGGGGGGAPAPTAAGGGDDDLLGGGGGATEDSLLGGPAGDAAAPVAGAEDLI